MSLMLKGVDMPEKGETLILKIKDSRIYREYPRYKFQPTRIKDAQAIQIPKDHGNIKDEKDLAEIMDKELDKIANEKESISKSARLSLISYLALKFDAAPTILKGE